MRTYHFRYQLAIAAVPLLPFSVFIFRSGHAAMGGVLAACGLLLLFYNLAYIELTDEALTVRWRPYKKLVFRTIHLKDITSITARRRGFVTMYYLNIDGNSESYANIPAIGWPDAYQVGQETRDGIGLVADVAQRVPHAAVDEVTQKHIQRYMSKGH